MSEYSPIDDEYLARADWLPQPLSDEEKEEFEKTYLNTESSSSTNDPVKKAFLISNPGFDNPLPPLFDNRQMAVDAANTQLEAMTSKYYETLGRLDETSKELEGQKNQYKKLKADLAKQAQELSRLRNERWKDFSGKIPPQAIAEETKLLGVLFKHPQWREPIHTNRTHEWFYKEAHQVIYNALAKVGGNATPLTVASKLRKQDRLEQVGGQLYLEMVAQDVTEADERNFELYVKHVRQAYLQRSLMAVCHEMYEELFRENPIIRSNQERRRQASEQRRRRARHHGGRGNDGVRSRIPEKQSAIEQIKIAAGNVMDLLPYPYRINYDFGMIVDEAFKRLEDTIARGGKPRISTMHRDLDRLTHGVLPGRTGIITAGSKIGKTTLAMTLAGNIMHQGFDVAYFSYESKPYELIFKLCARAAGIDLEKFEYFEKEYKDFSREEQELALAQKHHILKLPFHPEGGSADPDYIISKSKYLKMLHPNLSAVFIDGIQSFSGTVPERETKANHYYNLMNMFNKQIAEYLGVQLIVLGQLGKIPRKDKKPSHIDQIMDCKGLGDVSDWAVGIYEEGSRVKGLVLGKRQGERPKAPFDFLDGRAFGVLGQYE